MAGLAGARALAATWSAAAAPRNAAEGHGLGDPIGARLGQHQTIAAVGGIGGRRLLLGRALSLFRRYGRLGHLRRGFACDHLADGLRGRCRHRAATRSWTRALRHRQGQCHLLQPLLCHRRHLHAGRFLLDRLHLRLGVGIGKGELETGQLLEELFPFRRGEPVVRALGDHPLGLRQHGAGMSELAGRAGTAGQNLGQGLGRRLQHRQKIARRVGQPLLRSPLLVIGPMLDTFLGPVPTVREYAAILHRDRSTFA
jgi:hypothetical protein